MSVLRIWFICKSTNTVDSVSIRFQFVFNFLTDENFIQQEKRWERQSGYGLHSVRFQFVFSSVSVRFMHRSCFHHAKNLTYGG